MVELRPYQVDGIRRIREAARGGPVLAVSPTGSGKTTIYSEIARRSVEAGRRVLALAHRAELIDQGYDRLRALGLDVGAVCASSSRAPNPYHPTQIASIQTLLARNLRPEADVILWDEAHHAPSDLWSGLAEHYRGKVLVGFTATPERSDGRGLGEIYRSIVEVASVRELVELGHLVPCSIVRPARRMPPKTISQHPVSAWLEHGENRQTIVFASWVHTAREYVDAFKAAGVEAALITGESTDRADVIARYRAGEIRVIVNVYVLTEGFDAPETSCVVLARSCGTAGTYLQMVGRGLRPAPGKSDCILIDLAGVSWTHREPEFPRRYSLDGKGITTGSDDPVDDQASCRVCGAPLSEDDSACPDCGTERLKPEAPKVSGDPLIKFARKRAEDDSARAVTLARWMREARERGYKHGWITRRYEAVYGERPTFAVQTAASALLEQERAA